ncbi:MAG: Tim44 domain-containing protein [Betaproteobacteria bacterium]|nr:MAG: Tim44 domain-containing protein [Betaproteobacteria bacterium]
MNRWVLGFAVALLGFATIVPEADARRIGGGRSIGAQRSITSAPAATPVRPAQQAAPASQPGAAPAATQQQPASGLSRWAPVLGGLAIGGLIGALLGGSGIGNLIMSWLVIGLVVFGVRHFLRMLAQRRAAGAQPIPYAAGGGPLSYQSLGNETVAAPPPSQAAGFEGRPLAVAAQLPAGFDSGAFLRAAKLNFMKLQLANDTGRLDELREFTTPELYEELQQEVTARGGSGQQTDVLSLHADLLEVVTEAERHWASVRFSGQIRETRGVAPEGFEEVWNLAKPVDGSSGWLLAGIQQMH